MMIHSSNADTEGDMEKVKDCHVPDLAHRHQDSVPGLLLADSVQGLLLLRNAIDLLEDSVQGLLSGNAIDLLADSVQGLLLGNAIDLLEDYVLGLLHADSVPGLLLADTILKSMQESIVLSVFGMQQKDQKEEEDFGWKRSLSLE
jgi:hypothetical protein